MFENTSLTGNLGFVQWRSEQSNWGFDKSNRGREENWVYAHCKKGHRGSYEGKVIYLNYLTMYSVVGFKATCTLKNLPGLFFTVYFSLIIICTKNCIMSLLVQCTLQSSLFFLCQALM